MPVTTAAATSEPNTRLRFVVAASIILSLHGNVPRGFHRQHRRSRVDADPVTRDGTPHHPHVIWYPDSHPNGGHGCATVPDSHQLPHTTQASTHPLGQQRTHYPTKVIQSSRPPERRQHGIPRGQHPQGPGLNAPPCDMKPTTVRQKWKRVGINVENALQTTRDRNSAATVAALILGINETFS